MTQHAYSIANQAGAAFRGDLNNALAAIVSQNSGATAPATTYAYMLWADTSTGLLKIRDSSNAAWITVGQLGVANLGIVAGVQATIQDGSETYLGSVTGTNTITATASPTLTAQMPTGSLWKMPAAGANTTAMTVNVDGQGAVSIVRPDGTATQANDIPAAGYIALLEKRAADVVLLNPANLIASQLALSAPINEAQGANIASAATVNLDTATGNYVHITGTTTITGITLSQGHERTVVFDGALTLTNGASLILPGGANITTAAGDTAVFRGEAGGVVRCISYLPKSMPTQLIKAWCNFNGTLTGTNAPISGFNVSSVTRNSAGNYTINFTNPMPDANYQFTPFGSNSGHTETIAWVSQTTNAATFVNSRSGVGPIDMVSSSSFLLVR